MGPKQPQIRVSWLFWQILLLFFVGFSVQWMYRELFVSVVNTHIKENSVSQVMDQKWAPNGPKLTQINSFVIILKDFVVSFYWI